jgi:hypothetical protein
MAVQLKNLWFSGNTDWSLATWEHMGAAAAIAVVLNIYHLDTPSPGSNPNPNQ